MASQNSTQTATQTTAQTTQARTVNSSAQTGKLDIRSLVLLAVLLAVGFILNFVVGKALAAVSGGMIQPEFIISAFCLMILIVRPGLGQALIVGLISAAVIQLTTSSPFIDFAAEGVAAVVMALIVRAGMKGRAAKITPLVGTFVTTLLSGVIFMVIKVATMGFATQIIGLMLPVIALTAVFNAVLVAALYIPLKGAMGIED